MASGKKRAGIIFIAIVLAAFVVFVGVRAVLFTPPYIESVFPRTVQAGDVVVISGNGFSPKATNLKVLLNNKQLTVMTSGKYHIVAVLPEDAKSGMLRVLRSGRASNAVSIEVLGTQQKEQSAGGMPHIFYEPDKAPTAPDFALPNRKGKTYSLSNFKGKIVVLNFWASWCKPCVEELPSLQKLAEHFKSKNLAVIAVSVDKSWSDVDTILKGNDGSMVVLLDNKEEVPKSYGTTKYPETYIIGINGKILGKFVGSRNWTSDLFLRFFEQLLQNSTKPAKDKTQTQQKSDTTKQNKQ